MADKQIAVPVTTSLQAAWDAKPIDWKEQDAVVLDLKDGDNGSLRIEDVAEKQVDIVLRAPALPAVTRLTGSVPISTDNKPKHVRLVIDARAGEIETDCTREIVGTSGDPPSLVYKGVPKIALSVEGLDEVILLGTGPLRDTWGNPARHKTQFKNGRLEIDGDQLHKMLTTEEPTRVFAPKLEGFVPRWPSGC